MSDVRTRFAPSPTGDLHLGSVLALIANEAFSAARGGELLLRIDDTDAARSTEASVEALLEIIAWLGAVPTTGADGSVRQSARNGRYLEVVEQLVTIGSAYPCFCSEERLAEVSDAQKAAGKPPRYDGLCAGLGADERSARIAAGEDHVIRMTAPGHEIVFVDAIRGEIATPVGAFGDFVVRRSDGSVGYLLASVVDDMDFGITHVIRGEDHLSNTPRQLAIWEAVRIDPPTFAHFPLLLSEGGKKLAKRDPMGSIAQLREEGFHPDDIRSYLFELLGCGATPRPQLTDLSTIPKNAPHVSVERLHSIAVERMQQVDLGELREEVGVLGALLEPRWEPLIDDVRTSCATVRELVGVVTEIMERPGLGEATTSISVEAWDASRWAGLQLSDAVTDWIADDRSMWGEVRPVSEEAAFWLERITWIKDAAKAQGIGLGLILKPLRVALTDATRGPHLELICCALGAVEVEERLKRIPGWII